MKWKSILAATLVTTLLVAQVYVRGGFRWGPTNIEVIEAFQPKFAPLHKTLSNVVETITAQPPVEKVEVNGELSPQPILHFDDPDGTNLSMVALIYLQTYQEFDPWGGGKLTPLDRERLRYSISDFDHFSAALAWTGTANPLANSVRQEDGSEMEDKLERALRYKYLLVGRSRELPDEEGNPRETPTALDLFLVRLADGEIVASVPLVGPTRTDDIIVAIGKALEPHVDIEWPTYKEQNEQ